MMNIKLKAILGSIPLLIILAAASLVSDNIVQQLLASLGVVYGVSLFRYFIKHQEKSKAIPKKHDLVG